MTRTSRLAVVFSGLLATSIGCSSVYTAEHGTSTATSSTSGAGGALAGSSSTAVGGGGVGGSTSTSTTTATSTSTSTGSSGGTGGSACVPFDDGNACTVDGCQNGAETHASAPAGTVCTPDGAVCDAAGNCAVCPPLASCPGPDTVCRTRACVQGGCGFDYAPAGTPLPEQVAGDCQRTVCDGSGLVTSQTDSTDPSDDSNPCTVDACMGGAPSHVAMPQGAQCGPDLVCNAGAVCVQCNAAVDCPGVDDACHTRTCTAGQCGVIFSPDPGCATP